MPSSSGDLGDNSATPALDSSGLPSWALTYADAALRCGQDIPQIQQHLVKKGLPESMAEAVVPRCLELRIQEVERCRKRAVKWKWINRVAFAVVFVGYVAALWSVNTTGLRPIRTASYLIPFGFLGLCEVLGKNHMCFDSDASLRRSILLVIAGWIGLLALAAAIRAMVT
jgi:hypothetical protein